MRSRLLSASIVLAGLLSGSPRAAADTVSLQFNSYTPTSVSIQYTIAGTTTTATDSPGPYYWTQSSSTPNSAFPNSVTTFCVELNQYISTGSKYTYTSTPLASQSGVSSLEATDITKLYGAYYNTAWNNTSFKGSIQSEAFQLALWKLVYDGGTNLSLASGNFLIPGSPNLSDTSTAAGLAQSWLNALSGISSSIFSTNFSGQQLVWLSSTTAQDQLTIIPTPPSPPVVGTPAPPGLVLAGIGFMGLIGRGIRRKTTNVTNRA